MCAVWPSQASSGLFCCTAPYPSASQTASHSVDEFWSGGCDVFVIRAACGGQGGKARFWSLIPRLFTWLCGNVGQAQRGVCHYILPLEGRASCQLNQQLVCSTVLELCEARRWSTSGAGTELQSVRTYRLLSCDRRLFWQGITSRCGQGRRLIAVFIVPLP